ncbi:hypothetical protein BJ508DRAFT_314816 [Ascobolus immersus RN42]|uniref:Uncharacterized protein n=1 Tax=Ascobolus immersus RN42 TaxID=1160509 RepID=A0A3N4HRQ0_ASCIM|nr:hypothetical protein BJ508DRAFT_314816 [Ascobolus immersus RN42]
MGRKEVFTPTDSDTDEGHDTSDDARSGGLDDGLEAVRKAGLSGRRSRDLETPSPAISDSYDVLELPGESSQRISAASASRASRASPSSSAASVSSTRPELHAEDPLSALVNTHEYIPRENLASRLRTELEERITENVCEAVDEAYSHQNEATHGTANSEGKGRSDLTDSEKDWTPTTSRCGSPHSQGSSFEPISIDSVTDSARENTPSVSSGSLSGSWSITYDEDGQPESSASQQEPYFEPHSIVYDHSGLSNEEWPPLSSPISDDKNGADDWEDVEEEHWSPVRIVRKSQDPVPMQWTDLPTEQERLADEADIQKRATKEHGRKQRLDSGEENVYEDHPGYEVSLPVWKNDIDDSTAASPSGSTSSQKKEAPPPRPDTPVVPALVRYKEFKKSLKAMREAKRREEKEKELAQNSADAGDSAEPKTPEKKAKRDKESKKTKKEKTSSSSKDKDKTTDEKSRLRTVARATAQPPQPTGYLPDGFLEMLLGGTVMLIVLGACYLCLTGFFFYVVPGEVLCKKEISAALSAHTATIKQNMSTSDSRRPQKVLVNFETVPCATLLAQDPENKENLFFIQFDGMCVTLSKGAMIYWAPEFNMRDMCGSEWVECPEGKSDRKMELMLPKNTSESVGYEVNVEKGEDAESTLEALRKADEMLLGRIEEYNRAREESAREKDELLALKEQLQKNQEEATILKADEPRLIWPVKQQSEPASATRALAKPDIGPLFELGKIPALQPLQPKNCNPWSISFSRRKGIERVCYDGSNDCYMVARKMVGAKVIDKPLYSADDKSKTYHFSSTDKSVHVCNANGEPWNEDDGRLADITIEDVKRWIEEAIDYNVIYPHLTKDQVINAMWSRVQAYRDLGKLKAESGRYDLSAEEEARIVELLICRYSLEDKRAGILDKHGRVVEMMLQWEPSMADELAREREELEPDRRERVERIGKEIDEILYTGKIPERKTTEKTSSERTLAEPDFGPFFRDLNRLRKERGQQELSIEDGLLLSSLLVRKYKIEEQRMTHEDLITRSLEAYLKQDPSFDIAEARKRHAEHPLLFEQEYIKIQQQIDELVSPQPTKQPTASTKTIQAGSSQEATDIPLVTEKDHLKRLTKEVLRELILEGLIDTSGQAKPDSKPDSTEPSLRSSILEELTSSSTPKEDTTYTKSAHQLTSNTDSIRPDGSTKASRWKTSGSYSYLRDKYKQMKDVVEKEKEKSMSRLEERRKARAERKAREREEKSESKKDRKTRREERRQRVREEWEKVSRRLRGDTDDDEPPADEKPDQHEEEDQEKGYMPCFLRHPLPSAKERKEYIACLNDFFRNQDPRDMGFGRYAAMAGQIGEFAMNAAVQRAEEVAQQALHRAEFMVGGILGSTFPYSTRKENSSIPREEPSHAGPGTTSSEQLSGYVQGARPTFMMIKKGKAGTTSSFKKWGFQEQSIGLSQMIDVVLNTLRYEIFIRKSLGDHSTHRDEISLLRP